MGTNIVERNGLNIRRFVGGVKRGVCYQITINNKYVVFTQDELLDIIADIILAVK
jgi:hypothetical protein